MLAAEKVLVLVALEITEAHDHLVRIEGRCDLGDAIAETLHEEGLLVLVAMDQVTDLSAQGHVTQFLVLKQGQWVRLDVVVDDELLTSQSHTGIRQSGELEGKVRTGHVQHDRSTRTGHIGKQGFLLGGME